MGPVFDITVAGFWAHPGVRAHALARANECRSWCQSIHYRCERAVHGRTLMCTHENVTRD